jgi:hypothetical protein
VIVFVLFLLCVAGVSYVIATEPDTNFAERFKAWLNGVGLSLVAAGFVGGLASMIVYTLTVDDVPRRFDIESLGDGTGTEGRFFLGSGSVDTEAVFFYYAPRKGGGYGLFHVDANTTAIYEDQTSSGYLVKYCEDAASYARWIDLPFIDVAADPETKDDRYSCGYSERNEFHIPENSIDRRFNLDAQ